LFFSSCKSPLYNKRGSKKDSNLLILSNSFGLSIQESSPEIFKLANTIMSYLTGMKALFLMILIGILLSSLVTELNCPSLWELGMAFRMNAVLDAENQGLQEKVP
jgi:hypothetical protein